MKAEPTLILPPLVRLILPVFCTVPSTKSEDVATVVLYPTEDKAPANVLLGLGRKIFPVTKPLALCALISVVPVMLKGPVWVTLPPRVAMLTLPLLKVAPIDTGLPLLATVTLPVLLIELVVIAPLACKLTAPALCSGPTASADCVATVTLAQEPLLDWSKVTKPPKLLVVLDRLAT